MPTLPGLKMLPGMMPILHSPGVITPGQFGPIRRDFEPHSARLTLTMSSDRDALGDADDQRHSPPSIASRMASAAQAGGT